MNEFIYNYHNKTEFGRVMITSKSVSNSDLLFMIPNNIKRSHGLPVTRTYGKRKSTIKKNRRRNILFIRIFDIVEELVQELMLEKFREENFFMEFVDVKNVSLGDRNSYAV